MSRDRWERWKASTTNDAGDEIVLEYSDQTIPCTHWEPAEYYIEYHSLKVNGIEVDSRQIETVLDNMLDEDELREFFDKAKPDPDY